MGPEWEMIGGSPGESESRDPPVYDDWCVLCAYAK